MPTIPLTPFQEHYKRWATGCGSDQCEGAKKCFARGKIPCDILFVGEAPGVSEASTGFPFVGPAGRLLDEIIQRGLLLGSIGGLSTIKCCFTNLVMCIPRDEVDGSKTEEPSHEQIQSCKKRLEEFIKVCSPRVIIAVGNLSESYLDQGYRHSVKIDKSIFVVDIFSIVHPAAILRATQAQQGLMQQRCIVTIANAAKRLKNV